MNKKIEEKEYELVRSEYSGCKGCCFRNNDELCDLAGEDCFKGNHKNDFSMIWEEVKK